MIFYFFKKYYACEIYIYKKTLYSIIECYKLFEFYNTLIIFRLILKRKSTVKKKKLYSQ